MIPDEIASALLIVSAGVLGWLAGYVHGQHLNHHRTAGGIDILAGILSYCPDSGPSREVGPARAGCGAPPVCAGRRVSGAMGGAWKWTTLRHGENFI